MAITWSNDVALNNDEMFCVGIDYYILSENNYQATIRADVYISTWLYGSSTYAFWVKIGLHTSTTEFWVNLKDGKYQLVKTWDVTVTKSNDSSFNAYCYAIGWTHDLYTNTVGGNLSVAKGYWHYVAYDANGGIGAPASQIKYYGAPIYLSSAAPTRENYDFTGWKNTLTGEVTQAGGAYGYDMRGTNTLVAQWQIIHKPPSVAIQQPYRVASADATEAISLGTYVRAPVTWACDQTGYETVECASVTATVIADDSSEVTDVAVSGTITGAAGTAYVVFPLATTSHTSVSVTVTETATPASGDAVTYQAVSTAYVGKANVPLDIANKGNSVAILSTAGEEDTITLGSLTIADVTQNTIGTLPMSRLLGFIDALNNNPRDTTINNAASGMYCQAFETPTGVILGANSTGTSFSARSVVCKVYTTGKFSNTGEKFMRGVFAKHQSGIYVAYGSDGHTITITTEGAPSLAARDTLQVFIPCMWTVDTTES